MLLCCVIWIHVRDLVIADVFQNPRSFSKGMASVTSKKCTFSLVVPCFAWREVNKLGNETKEEVVAKWTTKCFNSFV